MFIKIYFPCSVYFDTKDINGSFEIKTEQGEVYHNLQRVSQKTKVNFPKKGLYLVNNNCRYITKDLQPFETQIQLPTPERDHHETEVNLQIFKETRPDSSPARTYAKEGIMLVNEPIFLKSNIQQRIFILLHEWAHRYYTTEYLCDLWAAKKYCEWGFNPSQAFSTLAELLQTSTNQKETKQQRRNRERIFTLLQEISINE